MNNNPFAEVIAAKLNIWESLCWKWDMCPTFGSPIKVISGTTTLYGLVYEINTGASDPHRTPYAYQKTEQELKQDHPHIFSLLQTSFHTVILGYQENNALYYQWAPQPAKIHSFVYPLDHKETVALFTNDHYLSLIFSSVPPTTPIDELLLGLLTHLHKKALLSHEHLAAFLEHYGHVTGNDYKRLKLFLQRVEDIRKK